jgi:DNA-binding transcriptional LysR family regulator
LAAVDLAGLPLVFMSRAGAAQVYDAVMAALRIAGVQPRSLLESSSPESSLSIVAAGLAVSVKAKSEVEAASEGGDAVVWKRLIGFDLDLWIVAAWDTRRVTAPLRVLIGLLSDKPRLSGEKEHVLDTRATEGSTPEVNNRREQ